MREREEAKGGHPPIHAHTHTHTHRTYDTVLFYLVKAGEVAQAREIAEKAPPKKTPKLLASVARMERTNRRGEGQEIN
jgi:hypothetical protein